MALNRSTKVACALVLLCATAAPFKDGLAGSSLGKFIGRLITSWDGNGRDMRLEQPFKFIDPEGKSWPVPKGTVVDGASIPQFLWSVIGGPFSGKYRYASVIHDYYCAKQARKPSDTHKVFYTAAIASGVSKGKAWVLYKAVDTFGPSWPSSRSLKSGCEAVTEDNLEDCVTNFAAGGPKEARNPSATEINEFLSSMRSQGFDAEVDEIEKSLP